MSTRDIPRYRKLLTLNSTKTRAIPVMEPHAGGSWVRRADHVQAMREARDSRSVNIDAMQETNLRLTRELAEATKKNAALEQRVEDNKSIARVNAKVHEVTVVQLADQMKEVSKLRQELCDAWRKLQDLTLKV